MVEVEDGPDLVGGHDDCEEGADDGGVGEGAHCYVGCDAEGAAAAAAEGPE